MDSMGSLKIPTMGWHVLTALILIGLVWGLAAVTNRINYQWTWYRLPEYFVFQSEEVRFAPGDGKVESLERLGDQVRLILVLDNGARESLTISHASLELDEGERVRAGDPLGAESIMRQGLLVKGMVTTLHLSLLSGLLAMAIGLLGGLARISKNPTLYALSTGYIEVVRGTPLLVQLFIFYFFIGTVLELSRYTAGLLALAIFSGAYVAEIIRAGIQSIHRGQMEAARSLGMNYFQAMAYIILPQAVKRVLPALAGQFISLIKDSSLVSVIAITDLAKAGREIITNTFATFEIWFTVAALYFVLTFSLSLLTKTLERRMTAGD